MLTEWKCIRNHVEKQSSRLKKLRQGMQGMLAVGLLTTLLASSASWAAPQRLTKSWQLTFSDEFTQTTVDTSKWLTTYAYGRRSTPGTGEVEYYADDAFNFSNGVIGLRADKRALQGYNYTSGMLCSFGKFSQQYGYFEMRARLPKGKGFWPAFWLMPNNEWPPEIDIMENLGQQPNIDYMTNHWTISDGSIQSHHASFTGPDLSQGFHTYGLLWQQGLLVWYVDGVERARSTQGVPAEKMYILANLAVGGNWGGQPDASTPFPSYFQIDYIRAYAAK